MNLSYRVHRQTFGWEKKWLTNGQVSGTTGQSKRLEGITIALTGNKYSGSVHYRTHVQSYGWMNTVKDGTMSGTQGEAKRLEAIEIALSGDMARHYDIYYRVHSQTYGWLGWAKNGEPSGTAGGGKRLEAIQIALVEKGGCMPPATYGGVTSDCTNAYINLSNTPTNNLVIDSGAQGDDSQGDGEYPTTEDVSNSIGDSGLFEEIEPDYAEGDHVHNWEKVSGQLKHGVACNGCYKDISDYEDYYDCCGGWHDHSWMLVPDHFKCTICDVKVHRHKWRWLKPTHYTDSENVMTEGHYMCYGCFMRCWDGGEADPSVYPYSWDSAAFDASEYIMEVQYVDEKDYSLSIESISINKQIVCMVPGDTKKLSVKFTPENTTDDRTIKWESNNPNVVSVEQNGTLTANSIGYAEITAYAINGDTSVSYVRVMETNILDVKSARLYVNGVDVTDKEFYVKTDENPTIEVRTVPENAIYTVKYKTTRLDDKKRYAVEVYPVEVGGVSQWAWINALEYTNSSAQMRVYSASTSTEITATVTDLEGNEYILKTRAIKQ